MSRCSCWGVVSGPRAQRPTAGLLARVGRPGVGPSGMVRRPFHNEVRPLHNEGSYLLPAPHAPQQIEEFGFVHPLSPANFFEFAEMRLNLLRRYPRPGRGVTPLAFPHGF